MSLHSDTFLVRKKYSPLPSVFSDPKRLSRAPSCNSWRILFQRICCTTICNSNVVRFLFQKSIFDDQFLPQLHQLEFYLGSIFGSVLFSSLQLAKEGQFSYLPLVAYGSLLRFSRNGRGILLFSSKDFWHIEVMDLPSTQSISMGK